MIAHAAVDRRDDAQRQPQFVQHGALLDVDLDKAQVAGRVAPQAGNAVDVQPRVQHGVAHGDAVGVLLVQPFRLEIADQGARPQERRAIALAFFFGEGDHLDVEGQPPVLAVQRAHAGHGHEDAEPTVVLAGVAYRVEMAARHEDRCAGLRGTVTPDHVADGIDADRVKAAVLHPLRDARGAGAVRVGQIGDCELAFLGVARIAVDAERLVPVPDVLAHSGFADALARARLGVRIVQIVGHGRPVQRSGV